MKCPHCQKNRKARGFPVHCTCGAVVESDGSWRLSSGRARQGTPRTAADAAWHAPGLCGHRGSRPIDSVTCKLCGPDKGRTVSVYGCQVHGTCTLQRYQVRRGPHAVCQGCNEYQLAPVRWRTTEELADRAVELAGDVPSDAVAVAGVPRSGMIPAAIVAVHRHLPLYAIGTNGLQLMSSGRSAAGGGRMRNRPAKLAAGDRVAVVDDSVFMGTENRRVREILKRHHGTLRLWYAATFAEPRIGDRVLDHFAEAAPHPHLFDWCFFRSVYVANCMLDLDGLLCPDVPPGQDDDGPRYRRHLSSVRPIAHRLPDHAEFRPRAIVTARLERYRQLTERWLARYHVQPGRLLMGPWASQDERDRDHIQQAATWKAEQFRADPTAWWFVESCPQQAELIYRRTGKAVICPNSKQVWGHRFA